MLEPKLREVPENFVVGSPLALMRDMIRYHKRQSDAQQKETQDVAKAADLLARRMAQAVYLAGDEQTGSPLVLQLRAALRETNVQLVTYEGAPVTDDLMERCEVVEWEEGTLDYATVKETIQPEIVRDGRVLQRAKLSCLFAPNPVAAQATETPALPADAPAAEEFATETATAIPATPPEAAGPEPTNEEAVATALPPEGNEAVPAAGSSDTPDTTPADAPAAALSPNAAGMGMAMIEVIQPPAQTPPNAAHRLLSVLWTFGRKVQRAVQSLRLPRAKIKHPKHENKEEPHDENQ